MRCVAWSEHLNLVNLKCRGGLVLALVPAQPTLQRTADKANSETGVHGRLIIRRIRRTLLLIAKERRLATW